MIKILAVKLGCPDFKEGREIMKTKWRRVLFACLFVSDYILCYCHDQSRYEQLPTILVLDFQEEEVVVLAFHSFLPTF